MFWVDKKEALLEKYSPHPLLFFTLLAVLLVLSCFGTCKCAAHFEISMFSEGEKKEKEIIHI